MWTISAIFTVLVIGAPAVVPFNPDDSFNVTRVDFARNDIFLDTTRREYVYHMEEDLYEEVGSILFVQGNYLRTTNGKTTSVVASGFKTPTGFKQLNSTHVVVVDRGNACLMLVNREDKSNKPFAGTCGASGYVEGRAGRFNSPWSVELDVNNPGYLLVTDNLNKALRSVEIETGILSTVTRAGFIYPRGMAWEGGDLLIVYDHYVSKVEWKDNVTVTTTRLAGTISYAYADGNSSTARFNSPHEITRISHNLYLIADYANGNLRLLDAFRNQVVPVCIRSSRPCTRSTSVDYPTSVLTTGDAVYIGVQRYIRKLSEYQCVVKNRTAYVTPYEERASVDLGSEHVGVFPPGQYQFRRSNALGAYGCDFFINVLMSPIVRTAAFRTEYDITCAALENHVSKSFLSSVLIHRKNQLQKLCGRDCTMSSRLKPWFVCEKDTLAVFWPTDTVFSVDIKDAPEKFSSPLRKKLVSSPLRNAEMVVLSHLPPLIKPRPDKYGETVSIVLTSRCADKSKTYQTSSDTCV